MIPNPPKLDKTLKSLKEVLLPKSDPPPVISLPEPIKIEEAPKEPESKPEGY